MGFEQRKAFRVELEKGINARMIGIDGTWARDCLVKDASSTGAKIIVKGSFEGLSLREFFLALSSTGAVYRRCQLVRVSGEEIGVRFLNQRPSGKGKRANPA
jgi:PilZ domain